MGTVCPHFLKLNLIKLIGNMPGFEVLLESWRVSLPKKLRYFFTYKYYLYFKIFHSPERTTCNVLSQ